MCVYVWSKTTLASNIVDIYEVDNALHTSRHVTKLLNFTCRIFIIKICEERKKILQLRKTNYVQ